MKPARGRELDRGFSLIELLVALGIFLLVTGAAFTLLSSSQQRYQTDSQLLTSFQEARLGLDQMVRDINDSGFPPPSFLATGQPNLSTSAPFAWSLGAGYPGAPCQIGAGGTCTTSTAGDSAPGDFDIIIETNSDPSRDPACAPNCPVQWIRYQLGGPNGTTLMRGVADKVAGTDPDGAFTGASAPVPFVQNVVNNVCPPQLPTCQTAYPAVFGGAPVPIFRYTCDRPSVSQSMPLPTAPCPLAVGDNSPANIRDVAITLIVAAPLPDATTGQPRLVQLSGRGRRINPNQ
jgi:prepilin-type N-terminal cleavage/methylation domain-containing protein